MAGRSAGGIGRARQFRSTSGLRNRPAIVALRTSEESSSIPCDRCPERPRTHKPRRTQLPTNPLSIALSSPQPYTVSIRSTAFLTLTSHDDRGQRHVRAGYVLVSAVLCALPLLDDSSGIIALRGGTDPSRSEVCGTRKCARAAQPSPARDSRMQGRTKSPACGPVFTRCLRLRPISIWRHERPFSSGQRRNQQLYSVQCQISDTRHSSHRPHHRCHYTLAESLDDLSSTASTDSLQGELIAFYGYLNFLNPAEELADAARSFPALPCQGISSSRAEDKTALLKASSASPLRSL